MKVGINRFVRHRAAFALLALTAVPATLGAGAPPSFPFENCAVVLECEDEQEVAELGDPGAVVPMFDSLRHDWLRVELWLRGAARESTRGEAVELLVHEVNQERADRNGQQGQRWPVGGAADPAVATVTWNAARREWILHARAAPDFALPELITEDFLRKVLGALVARPPKWDPEAQTTTVKRSGRWRRVGALDLKAEITQIWSLQPRLGNGLVPMGWRGPMTIVDPAARKEERTVGSGTASESGSIDQELGLYQDLIQSWDVRFKTDGGRYAWRHRCTTRVVPNPSSRSVPR